MDSSLDRGSTAIYSTDLVGGKNPFYGTNGLDAANFVHNMPDGPVGQDLTLLTIGLVEMLLLIKGRLPLDQLSKYSKLREIYFFGGKDLATPAK